MFLYASSSFHVTARPVKCSGAWVEDLFTAILIVFKSASKLLLCHLVPPPLVSPPPNFCYAEFLLSDTDANERLTCFVDENENIMTGLFGLCVRGKLNSVGGLCAFHFCQVCVWSSTWLILTNIKRLKKVIFKFWTNLSIDAQIEWDLKGIYDNEKQVVFFNAFHIV